ncbi:MAG TPA: ATP synthase F1 subunit gamma [Gemmataceae bacterium]|jgi:F-type H+-transporting ATPase subunit gamma|nr:ATP synthase F1 subunit gamma [Gemmataceae bacterium]
MAKTRAIVKRRKAIRNIRKITRTMELIATARFKKALDRATEAEPFTRKIGELAADLSASATNISHPLLQTRPEVKSSLLLVITSNRGLCGGYNASLIREASARVRQIKADGTTLHLELSGKRAISYFRFQRIDADEKFTHFEDKPKYEEVEVLANRYIQGYISGRYDRVEVVYMKFLNAARQIPVAETLLPLSSVESATQLATRKRPADEKKASPVEYEFLPNAQNILEELLPVSFKVRLFKCFLDAAVSEQIARRVAMKAATENAGDIIKSLTRQYNRARQAQITKEIAEVIGGAEALK